MDTKKKLVFATNNPNKLREARQILSETCEVVSLDELGCHDEIPETADTLAGNALIKARYINERYGCDCFADDTGLMVDALDGAPGVYSARFAGEHCTPADNVKKLLTEMQGIENRDAHFSTVIALIRNGEEHLFEGRVDGLIANEEHGDGGFGYDPVFIDKESGRSFACMTADEKNAISHRGRAMQKLSAFLKTFIITVIVLCGFAPAALAQDWRIIPSYDGQMENIVVTPDYVYFLGASQSFIRGNAVIGELYGTLFRYDINHGEMVFLNGMNELSGNVVKAIAYNYKKRYLAVALADGTVNLLYDSGENVFIPGLSIADASLDKTVNNISFDYASNRIFLATNFGFVVIDDTLNEIITSKTFGKEVLTCVYFKDKVWIGNSEGLFRGDYKTFSFSDYEPVANITVTVNKLNVLNDETLFLCYGTRNNYACGVINNPGGAPVFQKLSEGNLTSAYVSNEYYVTSSSSKITVYDSKKTATTYDAPPGYTSFEAATYNGRQFWISSGRQGISCLDAPTSGNAKWTVKIDQFFPDASNVYMSMSMGYHPDYGILVRNHGYEHPFAEHMYAADDVICGYKNMSWTPLSTVYRVKNGLKIDNPWGMAIDPQNTDHVYCGSERSGLFRLDLKNPEKSMQFSKVTDLNGNQNREGYVAVLPDNPAGTWKEQCVFSPPMFDTNGNLWTLYVDPEKRSGEGTSSKTTFFVWSPEARKATTSPTTFHTWNKIEIPDVLTGNIPKLLVLTQGSAKNMVLAYGNTNSTPIILLDHGGTPANTADDKMVKIKTVYDQDGESLAVKNIYCWFDDASTGLVWVAYNDGLFTFSPVEAMQNPSSVRRIKVPRNDGTNLADYLLNNVKINSIVADGSGRKWFGTQGAGLVCTSADGRTIYNTYTPDNSSLPGSTVYAVQYNPVSNSMMISTDSGLCELFLSGQSQSGGNSDVRCFPNPVRPDYFGEVTIDGLEEDAMVKIVDAAGNLVKECGSAPLGSVTWNLTNNFMKKVPGGVYFVMASGGPASESYAKVGKILVVD
ncbi:MAG: RdgB/HAM1 family non-canonical purine NTP pyrophosphatase [Bacteroidales bacterium]|nr:RdgB/HAM1 family non-canonical purine NTP pyrophosphatase [Bacteroidales bacterium]